MTSATVCDGIQDDGDVFNAVSAGTDAAAAAAERDVIATDPSSSQLRGFARAPARKSLGNNAALLGWLDAQERLQSRLDSNQVRSCQCLKILPGGGVRKV